MLTPIGNIHKSKIPQPGAIGQVRGLCNVDPKRRWRVVAFPLTDSPDHRYSIGIHTVMLEALDNQEKMQVSGFYFAPEDEVM